MSFNSVYYRREIPSLLGSCLNELRRFNTESAPTNEYGYNANLDRYVNLYHFKELDSLICDIVNDNDTIEVQDINAAANVFLFMSLLSDKNIINNIKEEDDKYTDDGIPYAQKEKVCYPLITMRAIKHCDWYLLGQRLMPRVIIGGEREIKRFLTNLQLDFGCKLPGETSTNEFYDKIYLSIVPYPGTINSISKKYYLSRENIYLEKMHKYSIDANNINEGKRFLDWMISCGVHANVRCNSSMNLW